LAPDKLGVDARSIASGELASARNVPKALSVETPLSCNLESKDMDTRESIRTS
jgi:hypothetical protein